MTIIQLEYLLAVANCGSFSLAAEHCFVTQPSLSMQVKALEEELGVVLLDRSKKPVIPTEAGEVVLEQARETIKAYNYIKEAVSELKGETAGKLRLGVIPTIAPYLLHKFIPAFVRDYPKVELEISEMITSDIVEALKRDRIDAALVASGTCGANGDNLTWTLDSAGTLTISGEGEMAAYWYNNNFKAPWTEFQSQVISVILEDGVTSIGTDAFAVCPKLTSIVIPRTLTAIRDFIVALASVRCILRISPPGAKLHLIKEDGSGRSPILIRCIIQTVIYISMMILLRI